MRDKIKQFSHICLMGFVFLYSIGVFLAIRNILLVAFLVIHFFPLLISFFKREKISLKKDWDGIIAGIAIPFLALAILRISAGWGLGLLLLGYAFIYYLRKMDRKGGKRKTFREMLNTALSGDEE